MGSWQRHPEFENWELWEAVGEDWPPRGPEACTCGARTHWVTRKVVQLEEPIEGKMKAYRYTVVHGIRPTPSAREHYARPEVEDHKRRASGEAA